MLHSDYIVHEPKTERLSFQQPTAAERLRKLLNQQSQHPFTSRRPLFDLSFFESVFLERHTGAKTKCTDVASGGVRFVLIFSRPSRRTVPIVERAGDPSIRRSPGAIRTDGRSISAADRLRERLSVPFLSRSDRKRRFSGRLGGHLSNWSEKMGATIIFVRLFSGRNCTHASVRRKIWLSRRQYG